MFNLQVYLFSVVTAVHFQGGSAVPDEKYKKGMQIRKSVLGEDHVNRARTYESAYPFYIFRQALLTLPESGLP